MKTTKEKVIEILGLEKDPDGSDAWYLLTRDENDNIIEGVIMQKEVDDICELIQEERDEMMKQMFRDLRGIADTYELEELRKEVARYAKVDYKINIDLI